MIYLDTSYIVKCYLREPGTREVLRWIEGRVGLCCCSHGRIELFAAVKRHVRESRLSRTDARTAFARLEADEAEDLWNWIPITDALIREACKRTQQLSEKVFLRAADGLHLTCAAESGFKEVYSHDGHFLAAAPHFGIKGIDIIQET